MKKPNSSLNIFVACAAASLVAGLIYGVWSQNIRELNQSFGKFISGCWEPPQAGDVYVDWASKDGKLIPAHWETFTDPKLKAESLKQDEHWELGIDGKLIGR